MKLALAETAAQALAAPEGWEVLALEPAAQAALARAGRPFRVPQGYVGWDVLEEAGLATFALLEQLCELLDEHVAAHDAEVARHELRPARWQFFPLKMVVDGALVRALRVRAVQEREQVEEMRTFGPERTPTPETAPATSGLRAWLSRRLRAHAPRAGDVLLLDDLYGVGPIAAELRRLGQRTTALAPAAPAPSHGPDTWWPAVAADERVRALFAHERAGDLWPLVETGIRDALARSVGVSVREHERVCHLLARAKPVAALTSMAAYPEQKARVHGLRRAGIPVAVARHGELGTRDVPIVAYQDLDVVDWALCWGRWEASWVERHAPQPVSTRVVGSPHAEGIPAGLWPREDARAALGIPADARVALYAPTALSLDRWYASRRSPDDSTYFTLEQQVVRTLRDAGLEVLVKEHGAHRPSALDTWCEGMEGVRLVYEPAFSRLVNAGDVNVLDAPSTTLVEAMFGTPPIVVVDHPVFVWEPGVREHLTAHRVSFATLETLAGTLTRLPEGRYGPDDREPLLSETGEPSALRAARAVLEIAIPSS